MYSIKWIKATLFTTLLLLTLVGIWCSVFPQSHKLFVKRETFISNPRRCENTKSQPKVVLFVMMQTNIVVLHPRNNFNQ